MTFYYGSWDRSGGNGMRVVLEVTRSSVGHSSSSVTWTVKYYTENQYRYDDLQTLHLTGGDIGGTVDYNNTSGSNSSGGGRILRATRSHTYNYGSSEYGSSPGSVTFGARVSGAYNGVTPSISRSFSIPARPYDEPADQTNVVLSRPTRERLRLTWDRHATSGEPYHSQAVRFRYRTEGGSGAWTDWLWEGSVSGGASSYTKDGLRSNVVYEMRVIAHNPAGSSSWVTSAPVGTQPSAPLDVRASLNQAATVTVRWTDTSYDPVVGYGKTFTIERSVDGGAWTQQATNVTDTTWTDADLPGGATVYRVRVDHSTPPGDVSDWSSSNTVQTQVPPLAPSNLFPSGPAPHDLDADLVLEWTHNDGGDGAAQSMYSLEYSADSGASWTPLATDVASSTSAFVLPGGTLTNAADPYLWRVRTVGITEQGYGPWSAGQTLLGRDAPVLTLTAPLATITLPEVTVSWTWSQAQGDAQQSFKAKLFAADGLTLLEEHSGQGATATHTFDHYPQDGRSYVVTVTGTSDTGQASNTAQATTTLDLPEPAAVLIEGKYEVHDGAVMLDLTPTAPGDGEVDVVLVDIERRVKGGQWVTLAQSIPVPTALRDPLPATTQPNEYRVTSISSIPSYRVNDIVTVEGGDGAWRPGAGYWGYLTYGDGFDTTVRVRGNMTISESSDRERTTQPFLGRRKPVLLAGAGTSRVVNVTGVVFEDEQPGVSDLSASSTPADFTAAGVDALMACWRDCTGRRMFGHISGVDIDQSNIKYAGVGFSVTEVDFTEAYT